MRAIARITTLERDVLVFEGDPRNVLVKSVGDTATSSGTLWDKFCGYNEI